MPTVTIHDPGCRGCALCVDICPTKVFEQDPATSKIRVKASEDCIGCTSCRYVCPSRCLEIGDVAEQRPFFRIEENASLIARFLQQAPVSAALSDEECDVALADVQTRLRSLAETVTDTMGRGHHAVGRKAGQLAAAHLPEMYEGRTIDEVLERLKRRFAGCFDFEATVRGEGAEIEVRFDHCALAPVVTNKGDKVGSAALCQLFHEYWAGLIGSFVSSSHSVRMVETGAQCTMQLLARR